MLPRVTILSGGIAYGSSPYVSARRSLSALQRELDRQERQRRWEADLSVSGVFASLHAGSDAACASRIGEAARGNHVLRGNRHRGDQPYPLGSSANGGDMDRKKAR